MFRWIAKWLIKELKKYPELRDLLRGETGCMGAIGYPADMFYQQWSIDQGKPDGSVEEFVQWFKDALKDS